MTFTERLIGKVCQQVHSKNVGFLLGAGSSYLDGAGYPLATQLWEAVKPALCEKDRAVIQRQMEQGCPGLEEALDHLDDGGTRDLPLRHRVAVAIADVFRTRVTPLDHHRALVRGLSSRRERRVALFSLNYDPLIERATDEEGVLLIDGFSGSATHFFHPRWFEYRVGILDRRKGKGVVDPVRGIINLYKLHGSMGWYVDGKGRVRRGRLDDALPAGARPLMTPPHHRKAQETGTPPYSTLWSEFRALLANDQSRLLSRLICVGYGMRDTHVNPILEAARTRSNFTLIFLARILGDTEFNCWKNNRNVIIATETRAALYGEEGPGVEEAWSFEWLAKEVSGNA